MGVHQSNISAGLASLCMRQLVGMAPRFRTRFFVFERLGVASRFVFAVLVYSPRLEASYNNIVDIIYRIGWID